MTSLTMNTPVKNISNNSRAMAKFKIILNDILEEFSKSNTLHDLLFEKNV